MVPQQTEDVHTMLIQCWPSCVDSGPTLNKRWFNVLCLLGPLCAIALLKNLCYIQSFPLPRYDNEQLFRGMIW